jgi:hypothetical protein
VGEACNDRKFCTTGEVCQPDGTCGDGGPTDCSALDDQCNTGVCDEVNDRCNAVFTAGSCDDGQFCTVGDACVENPDDSGTCEGGGSLICPEKPGCDGTCNENTDECDYVCQRTDDQSPRKCTKNGTEYSCKFCGTTKGSVQVVCVGGQPTCVCQDRTGCTLSDGSHVRRGETVGTVNGGICEPVTCAA